MLNSVVIAGKGVMGAVDIQVLKSGQTVVEFEIAASDPRAVREQLQAACLAAASLGYEFATIQDSAGVSIQIPTDADEIVAVPTAAPVRPS